MALEFGLGARLTFAAEKAIQNVGKASRAFGGLTERMDRVRQGVGRVGQGLSQLRVASVLAGAGTALTVKTFADFEKQMSVVASISLATAEQEQGPGRRRQEGRRHDRVHRLRGWPGSPVPGPGRVLGGAADQDPARGARPGGGRFARSRTRLGHRDRHHNRHAADRG